MRATFDCAGRAPRSLRCTTWTDSTSSSSGVVPLVSRRRRWPPVKEPRSGCSRSPISSAGPLPGQADSCGSPTTRTCPKSVSTMTTNGRSRTSCRSRAGYSISSWSRPTSMPAQTWCDDWRPPRRSSSTPWPACRTTTPSSPAAAPGVGAPSNARCSPSPNSATGRNR